MGSVACWKRHKSANYRAATECLNETLDMRMKTTLFERQSETLNGKHRPKIVNTVVLQYFCLPTSGMRAENRLQVSRDKRKRANVASDNLSCYVAICLNGDYLNRNAYRGRLWEYRSLNIRQGNRVFVVVRARESLVHGEGRQCLLF